MHKNKRVELGFKQRKNVCKFKYDTIKIIWTNRVKGKKLIQKKTVCWVGWQPRVKNCAKRTGNNRQKI